MSQQQAIDEAKMKELKSMEVGKPPTKDIGFIEYPKVIYLHPKDKSKEQISKTVQDKAEEEKFLKLGYRLKPHVPQIEEALPEGFDADVPEAPKLESPKKEK